MQDLAPEPQVEHLPQLYGADPAQLLEAVRERLRGIRSG